MKGQLASKSNLILFGIAFMLFGLTGIVGNAFIGVGFVLLLIGLF